MRRNVSLVQIKITSCFVKMTRFSLSFQMGKLYRILIVWISKGRNNDPTTFNAKKE